MAPTRKNRPKLAHIWTPQGLCANYVDSVVIVDSLRAHQDVHSPARGPNVALTYSGHCSSDAGSGFPTMAITGIHTSARHHHHSEMHGAVVIRFKPLGTRCLASISLRELANTTIDASAINSMRRQIEPLFDALQTSKDTESRMKVTQHYLNMWCTQPSLTQTDRLLQTAIEHIEKAHGQIRVATLAQHVGLSPSALQRRFVQAIGIGPRAFANIVRFDFAQTLLRQGHHCAEVAQAAGYFDQAHWIKDFHRYADRTPTQRGH